MVLRLALAIIVIALQVTAARADKRDEASAHARRAVALYEIGRFDQALVEFEQAYLLYPTDTLLFNLAQTHRKLGHCAKAVELYRGLLDRSPESERAAAVRRLLPQLEQACQVKDEAPRGVQSAEGDAAAMRVAAAAPVAPVAAAVPAAAPPPPPADTGEPDAPDAPAAAPHASLRIYAALTAGGVSASERAVNPLGAGGGATWRTGRVPFDPGLHVGVAGHRWASSGYRGSSSTISVLLTGGRAMHRPAFDLRIDGGIGATVLSGLGTGHPLVARGHRVTNGTTTVPQLEVIASGERVLGGGWRALAGVRAGVARGGATFGGALVTFAAFAGIGRGL